MELVYKLTNVNSLHFIVVEFKGEIIHVIRNLVAVLLYWVKLSLLMHYIHDRLYSMLIVIHMVLC